jgi:hypothetical protein
MVEEVNPFSPIKLLGGPISIIMRFTVLPTGLVLPAIHCPARCPGGGRRGEARLPGNQDGGRRQHAHRQNPGSVVPPERRLTGIKVIRSGLEINFRRGPAAVFVVPGGGDEGAQVRRQGGKR